MSGVLVSLTEQPIEQTIDYLKSMKQIGFHTIFTSLQIPEESNADLLTPLRRIGEFANTHQMTLMVDVSPRAFKSFSLPQMKESGVTGLRIDFGMEVSDIAALTHEWLIALNASTIDGAFLNQLRECHAVFSSLEAWHNYYPRPETGLSLSHFKEKNEWLKSQGLEVVAFIPGDGDLRGPIHEGLPTLEKHRNRSPFSSYIELQSEAFVDQVIIGDLSLQKQTLQQFKSWNEGVVLIRVTDKKTSHIWDQVHHNRPDIARDVIRSENARKHFNGSIQPANCVDRPIGTLTLDNDKYKRYKGEFQITLKQLPPDERVNVIGYVIKEDLPLLPFLQKSGYSFRFLSSESSVRE
ncbi:DUF871 domain-containing protein [Bacillus sp. AFS041924]|uniref:DUF871 domain-containing protein n=1 Tax=Bacillus sp. AFS041924 TaxID=2033503 RepID=UPI000BFD2897|nr:MupG family TIM beta-alpha barrel fold protein [Bacillus sp. AFS041924]PGS48418.1 cell surface protein [Bacillus sp. AFS041924]